MNVHRACALLRLKPVLCAVLGLAACQKPRPEPITVAVYHSTLACEINTKVIPCQEVAIYLHEVLKLKPQRQIIISAVFSDPGPKDDSTLDQIAEGVRRAGFKDVRTIRFDLK